MGRPTRISDIASPYRLSLLANPASCFHGRLHADGGPGGFADTAYTGTGLCVPDRKPKGHNLTASARDYNRLIASGRDQQRG